MYLFVPPANAKSIISFRFLMRSACGIFVYNVLKSYVAIDLAFLLALMCLILSVTGLEFWITQNKLELL